MVAKSLTRLSVGWLPDRLAKPRCVDETSPPTAPSEGHQPSIKHGRESQHDLSDTPRQSQIPVTGVIGVTSDLRQ